MVLSVASTESFKSEVAVCCFSLLAVSSDIGSVWVLMKGQSLVCSYFNAPCSLQQEAHAV